MNNRLEEIAENYLKPDATFIVDERMFNISAEKIVPVIKGPRVLEMGFGAGTYTSRIINRFGHSHLVDLSQKLLSKAQGLYADKVTTYFSSFEEFSPTVLFNTIIATNVLEHVDDPVKVLINMKTWMESDGEIFIKVPNANSFHRIYGVCMGMLNKITDLNETDIRIGHKRVYNMETLEKDIVEAGLRVVEKMPTFAKFLSNAQMIDFSEIQLTGLFKMAENIPIEYGCELLYKCVK